MSKGRWNKGEVRLCPVLAYQQKAQPSLRGDPDRSECHPVGTEQALLFIVSS